MSRALGCIGFFSLFTFEQKMHMDTFATIDINTSVAIDVNMFVSTVFMVKHFSTKNKKVEVSVELGLLCLRASIGLFRR